jgi:predicted ribosomally synthesized peptide with SipW-like signal peptide
MKTIIKSLVLITAVAAVASVATWAVFSATDNIPNNTVGTATVSIDAKGEANSSTASKPINVSNLVPGQFTAWYRGGVVNNSTVPIKLYMYVDGLTVGGACDKINLQVTTGFAGSDAGERARNVYNGALTGLVGAGNRVEVTGNPPFTAVPATWTQVIQQKAQLDSSADNTYQAKTCTWNEVFVGESTF